MAYISRHTSRAELWVANIDGSNPTQLTDTDDAEAWPTWSPDGNWIAFSRMQAPRPARAKVQPAGGATMTVAENGCVRPDWANPPQRVDVIDADTGAVSLTLPMTGSEWFWALPVPGG